jgi:phosphonate transport system substrate-binding protein
MIYMKIYNRKERSPFMVKNLRRGALIGVLLCFLTVSTSAHGEQARYTMAILPCFDVVMTFKRFAPMIAYLKQQTGFDIEILVPKDLSELESGIINGDVDFVLQDPHTYVKLAALFEEATLLHALNPEGVNAQHAVIIVRKDSGIRELKDLKGKTVMFGPKLSLTKWLAAKELLQDNGIDINEDLKAYSNDGCCEDIAFTVYLKAVDAGVICDHFFGRHECEQKELGIDTQQLLVIGKTREFPMRIFASRKELSNDVATQVSQALLKLDSEKPEHAKILHSAEFGGFEKASDREYDGIRTLIGVKR